MTGEFAIAVHALVYLDHKKTTLSSELLAENVCTNPARVRKVMSKLKKAGLVATKEGADGGYFFEKDGDLVSLKQIIEALDTEVVAASWKSGNREMKCLIASGMADVMDGICKDLDETCKEKLSQISIADVGNKIFGERSI